MSLQKLPLIFYDLEISGLVFYILAGRVNSRLNTKIQVEMTNFAGRAKSWCAVKSLPFLFRIFMGFDTCCSDARDFHDK